MTLGKEMPHHQEGVPTEGPTEGPTDSMPSGEAGFLSERGHFEGNPGLRDLRR